LSKDDLGKLMVDLEYVDKLKWNMELAERLAHARSQASISMRILAIKVTEIGVTCSYQYIHKLEEGRAESVSTSLVLAICKALNIDFMNLFPSLYLNKSDLL
jgi:transcriptional regulator with XRE-family HTH domain